MYNVSKYAPLDKNLSCDQYLWQSFVLTLEQLKDESCKFIDK